jgi:ring-1,2-phenylacetyl-CoA epoxidase subunit PaaC
MRDHHKNFILQLADNVIILGQRLGEICGHGPILEQDIAITNIALDLIGEARNYYQYLAEVEDSDEDVYPMQRDVRAFKNVLLVEQPNGHWGDTLMRQVMFDCFHYFHLEAMCGSSDTRLASIAKKSIKEASYHLSFSREWIIRLGDGTDESHHKIQQSLDDLMPYWDELFLPSEADELCLAAGIAPNLADIKKKASQTFQSIINESTCTFPVKYYSKSGGKKGMHSEHFGFILAEMQYLQKSYPGATW